MPDTDQKHEGDVRAAVEQFLLRRLRGDGVTVNQFVSEYPELGQELADGLRHAELVAVAQSQSVDERLADSARREPRPPELDSGNRVSADDQAVRQDDQRARPESSRGQLLVRCPHCQALISMDADTVWADVTCESCQSSFSLIERGGDERSEPLSQLAHFELLERVGVGAFGTVWRGRDTKLDRTVALKIPRKGQLSEKEAAMFMREAQAAAQVLHPNVVRIYEVGRHEDTFFITTEFIEGSTLADVVSGARPGARESAQLVEQVARGLHAAHQAGVVHRDLKPGNILVDADGQPHVADFGLAKHDASDVLMTIDGALVGTPAYMSPEQAGGTAHEADARSDVYSLGVILFQLVTGELPFRGTAATMIKQVVQDDPPHPRSLNPHVPRDLATICLRCLEKTPARRYQSAAALADELRRFLNHEPIQTRPIGVAGRTIRWAQRRPLAATMSVALLASLLMGTTISLFFALASQRNAKALFENIERLKDSAYAYAMTEVERAAEAGNTEGALLALDKYASGTADSHRRGPEWHHWWRLIHLRQKAMFDGGQRLRGLAVSPDEADVVWGGHDGHLYVGDPQLNVVAQMAVKNPTQVIEIEFSHGGQWLYSLSDDGTLLVIDFDQDTIAHRLKHPGSEAVALGISHDGKKVALGGTNDTEASRQALGETRSDADQSAEANPQSLILVWTVGDWDQPLPITGPDLFLRSLEWLPAGDQIIAAGDSGRYHIRLGDNPKVQLIPGSSRNVGRTSRVLDGGHVIAPEHSSRTGVSLVRVDADSDQVAMALQPNCEGGVSELEVDKAERLLAVPSAKKTIAVYDLIAGSQKFSLGGHRNRVTSAEFMSGSEALVTTSDDGTVRVWDTREVPVEETRRSQPLEVLSSQRQVGFAMSPNGKQLAVAQKQGIGVWGMPPGQQVALLPYPTGESDEQPREVVLAFSPDAQSVAVSLNYSMPASRQTLVWDVASNTSRVLDFNIPGSAFCFAADSRRLVFGTSSPRSDFPGGACALHVLSPDGSQSEKVWQPSDNEDIWRPHRMVISGVQCSADGARVYSISRRDRTLKAWRMDDGELLFSFRRPDNLFGASSLAVSRDSQTIAVGWVDNHITLVRPDGSLRSSLVGHSDIVSSLSFTADSRTLVSGSRDGTVKIWDAKIGQLRSTLRGHEAPIVGTAITPDGHWIVSLDDTGDLRSWNCSPD